MNTKNNNEEEEELMDLNPEEQEDDNSEDDYFEHQEIVIDGKQSPIRLDKFLMDRLMKISRNRVQNAIRAGSIKVNGKEVKPNFRIKPRHVVEITLPRPPGSDTPLLAENIPLDIRYEDDDLIVVHKPTGMVVHPGPGHDSGTLVNALAYYLQDLPVLDGNTRDRLGLVHRIDKDTSGLLLIAKTDYAMTHLAKQFFDHSIDRTYYALVWGDPEEDQGTVDMNVGRHPRMRQMQTTFPEGEAGKRAVTHYQVLERLYYVSLVKCKLETGRTHQIRVHMKHLGHPLFNDARYGGDKIVKGTVFSKFKQFVENNFKLMPRQALHAKSIGFVHPTTGEKMFFDSELPTDFQDVLERWRSYLASRKSTL
ncbi:MAG: pseudouridine synthase [Saprospiraceae bacterium]|nr:MAG: pseudouridine synthase [Saprospiraceae bacterium]